MAELQAGAPFLLYRDPDGRRVLFELPPDGERVTIGRRPGCDVPLVWDAEVSRLHAELVRMGEDWVVCDEGLSHNGTFLNGERVRGRRRLADGDVVRVGGTPLEICMPAGISTGTRTRVPDRAAPAVTLTPAQRRVLEALCRPLAGSGYAAPASNRQIADELVVSVDTVKGTLSALFELFGLAGLPQNQKRAALAAEGLERLRDQR